MQNTEFKEPAPAKGDETSSYIGGIEEGQLREFCHNVMYVLCGKQPLPNTNKTVQDRSVHPASDRDGALDYLTDLVKGMQFTVNVTIEQQSWVKEGEDVIIMQNLVVTLEGTEKKDEVLVFGAHYDVQNSLSSCWRGSTEEGYLVTQGADDNTSGTVACMALLKKFTVQPPKQTTIVVLFDGEEPGRYNKMTAGSGQFVKEYIVQKQLKVSSCFVTDMVGGPPTTHHGLVLAASELVDYEALQATVNDAHFPYTVTVAPKNSRLNCLNLSDSVHFPKKNIPTVLLANVGGFASVPDFYHTEDDTVDILDWNSFMNAIKLLFYLCENPLPALSEEDTRVRPDPELVKNLVQMGYDPAVVRWALEESKNDMDVALTLLG